MAGVQHTADTLIPRMACIVRACFCPGIFRWFLSLRTLASEMERPHREQNLCRESVTGHI